MLLSAASLSLTVAFADLNDLTERELRAWKKVQPSIVLLLEGQRVRGAAALISKDGLFITHATSVAGKSMQGRKSDGTTIKLVLVSTDDPTQFVLLKADGWQDDVPVLSVSTAKAEREGLLAVTPTGPVRAERARDTYGIVNPSRRMVPMSEVFLENNLPTMGGSLLINLDGKLTGALNAALSLSQPQTATRSGQGFGGGPPALKSQYGPGVLGSAYTIGPKILNRVVDGFLSEGHQVKHPAIGIFCRDAMPSGALIESVTKGSPAEKAGFQKGDIIQQMNHQAIRDQMDFARVMADQDIGETIKIWIQRGSLRQMLTVEVGS